ncbi:hypothetical protein D3C86_1481920 [compost metagenome]
MFSRLFQEPFHPPGNHKCVIAVISQTLVKQITGDNDHIQSFHPLFMEGLLQYIYNLCRLNSAMAEVYIADNSDQQVTRLSDSVGEAAKPHLNDGAFSR